MDQASTTRPPLTLTYEILVCSRAVGFREIDATDTSTPYLEENFKHRSPAQLAISASVTQVSYKQPTPPDEQLHVRSQVVKIIEPHQAGSGKTSVQVHVYDYQQYLQSILLVRAAVVVLAQCRCRLLSSCRWTCRSTWCIQTGSLRSWSQLQLDCSGKLER